MTLKKSPSIDTTEITCAIIKSTINNQEDTGMFYAISGLNGDYDAYKRVLAKLRFKALDDIEEEDIMNEEAVINTLEGEDVLYVLGDIIGAGDGSMKILQDMVGRDNVIAIAGDNELRITQSLRALDDHIRSTGDVPPAAIMDRITSMLGEELSGAVKEFVELEDDDREDILDYLDEISEEAFLEVMMARKKYVMVHAGIRNFDPDKELDEYEAEDFTSEPADLDKTYYRNRTLVVGHVPTTELGGDGRIVKKNNNIAIDCGCGRGGQMGIFCLNNGTEMYV